MVELVAEDVSDPYSGALWAVRDMIEHIQDKVAKQADVLMELHRETLKPKKRKNENA
jgi:hypothetical protein